MSGIYLILDFIMGIPEEFPLQHRFLNIMQFAAILGCTVCLIENTLFDVDIYTAYLCAAGGILTSGLYYLSRIKRELDLSATLSVLLFSLILLPGFWFVNGGPRSGILFYYFVVSGAIIIIMRGWKRVLFFFMNLAAFTGLILIEYQFPQYIINAKSRNNTYADLAMDSTIVMIMLTIMYFSIVRHYDIEHKKVRELLETDELSNCYNRRYLDQRLDQLIEGHQTRGDTFSLMLIDLDNFKEVNDSYGHMTGDVLIREMGNFLKSSLSAKYCVARYGGDEFVVLMPDVPLKTAVAVAEELRQKCSDHQWAAAQLVISLSIGIIEYEGSTREIVIQEVDNRMYGAKMAGKDRVAY